MGFAFSIRNLVFNDGASISIGADDVVVIVGPNNAGKTSCLREIVTVAKGDRGTIVSSVDLSKNGNGDDLLAWLHSHYKTKDLAASNPHLSGWQSNIAESTAVNLWTADRLADLVRFLFRLVDTETRLRASNATENVDLGTEPVQNPMQAAFERKELEGRICAAFRQAFGLPLFLDRWAGSKIRFRVGDPPDSEPFTEAWRKQITSTLHLQGQGDGMRSFVGCLLEVKATPHPVVLIDEPEAFLHSPQALQIGRVLARDKPRDRQLIIATHSAELLRGLLNADTGKVRVLRIRREGNVNPISQLDQTQVRELWADPLLRVSNLLDGLFHEAVVVCEGDGDARFYAAVLDSVFDSRPEERRPDTMFVHTGGKHRIAMAVRALRRVQVPVRAIADFDVLRDESDIKALFEALGGDWSEIRKDWSVVHRVMTEKTPALSLQRVKQDIDELFDAEQGPHLSESTARAIRSKLKSVSAWTDAKRTGSRSIPSGDPTTAYARMNQKLRERGLFVVEVGELERFAPSIGGEGPSWVNEVIKRDLRNDPELADARSFVLEIVDSLQTSGGTRSGHEQMRSESGAGSGAG